MDTTFFPGARRKIKLGCPALLVGKNEEKRIKLPLTMTLTDGSSLIGMPDWLGEAYAAVVKSISNGRLDYVTFQGVNIEGFATDQSAERDVVLPACKMSKFFVMRSGDSENPDVDLHFVAYTNYSKAAWKWVGEMGGYIFFAKFIGAQMTLKAPGMTEASEEEEGDENESSLFDSDREESLMPDEDEKPAEKPTGKRGGAKQSKNTGARGKSDLAIVN